VAFAPKENPQIAVVVHTEHSCHSAAAGPILHDVMVAYFKKYAPQLLDQKNIEKTPIQVVQPSESDE